MIRVDVDEGWALVTHPEHARLAAAFAERWGNERFAVPEPWSPIHYAVAHHDDGWLDRDSNPCLTRAGQPEAFTRQLVGRYSAFEEIDLPSYLEVRRRATAAVASTDLFSGLLVAMHTANLLTDQADPETIQPHHRAAYRNFLDEQQRWQQESRATLNVPADQLQRGFEFLQCCDHLSLIACCGYDQPTVLRHAQPDRNGQRHSLSCRWVRPTTWAIDPWPFDEWVLNFEVPCRIIPRHACQSLEGFREVYHGSSTRTLLITLVADHA